jgi:hypothetical protein
VHGVGDVPRVEAEVEDNKLAEYIWYMCGSGVGGSGRSQLACWARGQRRRGGEEGLRRKRWRVSHELKRH